MNSILEKTKIIADSDSYDFLSHVYCSGKGDIYERASERAYLDLCRTLRLNGVNMTSHRKEIADILRERISGLLASSVSQNSYDHWHKAICDELVEYFSTLDIGFTYGHAQKWVNMTMKYLYILDEANFSNIFDFLHVPIDSIVIDLAKSMLDVAKPNFLWSKIPDYDTYFAYQTKLRENISDMSPMRWELKTWISK